MQYADRPAGSVASVERVGGGECPVIDRHDGIDRRPRFVNGGDPIEVRLHQRMTGEPFRPERSMHVGDGRFVETERGGALCTGGSRDREGADCTCKESVETHAVSVSNAPVMR